MKTQNLEQITELLIKGTVIGIHIDGEPYALTTPTEEVNLLKLQSSNIYPDSICAIFKPESYDEFMAEDGCILPEWSGHIPGARKLNTMICKLDTCLHNILSTYEQSYGIPVLILAKLQTSVQTNQHPPISKDEIDKFITDNRLESYVSIQPVLGPAIGSGGIYHSNGK